MGCGSSLIEEGFEVRRQRSMIVDIKKEIREIIKRNPFYYVRMEEFRKFMKDNTDNIVGSIVTNALKKFNFDEFASSLFTDVLKSAKIKLGNIIPREKLLYDIISLLYFFLTKSYKEVESEKFVFILDLVREVSKVPNKEEVDCEEYYTGKFSYLITAILQLIIFSFVSFFVGITILDLVGGMDEVGIETLLVKKKEFQGVKPQVVSPYVNKNLKVINKHLTPSEILNKLVIVVFSPLENEILQSPSSKTAKIPRNKFEEVIKSVCDVVNAEEFVEIFFSGKLKKF